MSRFLSVFAVLALATVALAARPGTFGSGGVTMRMTTEVVPTAGDVRVTYSIGESSSVAVIGSPNPAEGGGSVWIAPPAFVLDDDGNTLGRFRVHEGRVLMQRGDRWVSMYSRSALGGFWADDEAVGTLPLEEE